MTLIDQPDIDSAELRKIVKGPDFPTGGFIYGREGIGQGMKGDGAHGGDLLMQGTDGDMDPRLRGDDRLSGDVRLSGDNGSIGDEWLSGDDRLCGND